MTDHAGREYLSPKEVADTLGVNVQTVRRWTREGRLESVKIGLQTIRISREAIARLSGSRFGRR